MKKKKIKQTVFALFIISVVLLTGCQKVFDYIHLPGNGDAVSNICQVKTIRSDQAGYVFNYNNRGDLESIITDNLSTGNPNVFFIYDRQHRTSQMLSSFTATVNTPGPIWVWEKYGYNAANQIIKDTTYGFGEITTDGAIRPSFQYVSNAVLQYDASNRVIASKDSVWLHGSFANTDYFSYKYDAQGNLAYTARQYRSMQPWGEALYNDTFRLGSYDNKIHIRRTNKMWMFIDRNYSVNNPFNAVSYNSYGLPLLFDSRQYLQGLITLVPFMSGNVTVEYNCN